MLRGSNIIENFEVKNKTENKELFDYYLLILKESSDCKLRVDKKEIF